MARLEVVPWSRASTNRDMSFLFGANQQDPVWRKSARSGECRLSFYCMELSADFNRIGIPECDLPTILRYCQMMKEWA
jgi:hypothetical protein